MAALTSPHLLEPAASGRATCRGCGRKIGRGEMRFGERLPNPFANGDDTLMTHWFHVPCAAFRRPEPFLETLAAFDGPLDDRERLETAARLGAAHRRLPRLGTAQRSPSGRATCRSCREPITKGAWRIALVYYEDGRFTPSGYVHVACAPAYVETSAIVDRVRHFSPDLTDADVEEISAELAGAG